MQQVQPPSVSPSTPVASPLLPFRVLAKGGLGLLAYTGGITFLVLYLTPQLNYRLQEYVSLLAVEYTLKDLHINALRTIAEVLTWILAAPVLLVACVLPVRIIWLHDQLMVEQLFTETFPSLRYAVGGLYLAIARSIYLIVAPLAMIAIYQLYVTPMKAESLRQAFYVATILVIIASVFKVAPVLNLVFISLSAQILPPHALTIAPEIFRNRIPKILALYALALLVPLGLHFLVADQKTSTQTKYWIELGTAVFIGWYVVTSIALITLESVTSAARREVKQPRA